jgi:putative copper resistance protein D
VAVLAAGLWMGALLVAPVIPGLPTEPDVTVWLLPLARFAREIAAALTVGALVTALLLLPRSSAQVLRWARGWAVAWLLILVPLSLLTVSDVEASSAPDAWAALGPILTGTVVGRVLVAQALLVVLALATSFAIGAWRWIAALAAVTGAALPALLGHGGLSTAHVSATASLALHIGAVSIWVGGLAVVVALAVRPEVDARQLLGRFSVLALWCVIVAGETGLLNAALRLAAPSQFTGTLYGSLVLVKALLLGFLIRWGWLQRSRVLPRIAVEGATPGALARYAGWELLAMGAALGVSVVLARLGPPNPAVPGSGFNAVALSVFAIGVPLLIVTFTERRPRWLARLEALPEVAALAFLIVVAAVGVVGVQETLLGTEAGAVVGTLLLVGAGWCWLAATSRSTGRIDVLLVMIAWPAVAWLNQEAAVSAGSRVATAVVTTVAVETLLVGVLATRARRPALQRAAVAG